MKLVIALTAVALLGATAPLDRAHAPLFGVLTNDRDDSGSCSPDQLRTAAAAAGVRVIDLVPGGELILYAVQHQCLCGAQNCPYYVVRLSAKAKPLLVFKTYGIDVRAKGRTGPIVDLIVDVHDNALVTDETRYIYAYGKYQPLRSERIRNTDHARKPDGMPVLFATGASSVRLHGSASLGWYDSYAFDAVKGQRLLIDGVRSSAKVTFSLFVPGGFAFERLRSGSPFVLPASGRYRLYVDVGDEEDVPYALTLAIR